MVTLKTLQGLKEKADEINLLLLSPSVDLWRLRELALSEGGLVNGTFSSGFLFDRRLCHDLPMLLDGEERNLPSLLLLSIAACVLIHLSRIYF